MHTNTIAKWQHTHVFGQDQVRSGERRTLAVVIITAVMMIVEVLVGIFFGSMALLADGIHMGSHMVGLLIALIAYVYARKYAEDDRFSFGTGKVNSLAAYTSALLLAVFALVMGYESIKRLFNPVEIQFDIAITVAFIGLLVNGASMLILGEKGHTHSHGEHEDGEHEHEHAPHDHEHEEHDHDDHDHADHAHGSSGTDHNLKAAYLHVFADAATSVLAIIALLAAKYFGWIWADPLMGIVGAFMVARWSFGLLNNASRVLLDHQIPVNVRQRIIDIIESYKDTRVSDLHLWCIGPGIYSANLSIVTKFPDAPNKYKTMIPNNLGVVHTTVEVHPCVD
ncbi:MAG: cation diffusion facilitator family transporter [Chloroflexi bacterium RBG_16_54_11]|nr:MAG: cation diffusion facilitator family transporter [Chloroflexi bacterium RBG_16_54_11]